MGALGGVQLCLLKYLLYKNVKSGVAPSSCVTNVSANNSRVYVHGCVLSWVGMRWHCEGAHSIKSDVPQ